MIRSFSYSPVSRIGRYLAAPITTGAIVLCIALSRGSASAWAVAVIIMVLLGAWIVHAYLWRSPLRFEVDDGEILAFYRHGRVRMWLLTKLRRSANEHGLVYWMGAIEVMDSSGEAQFYIWRNISEYEDLVSLIPVM